MHGGSDPDGTLDGFAREPVLPELALVRGHTGTAAVDGRDRQADQLELGLVHSRVADDIRPQPRGHPAVLRVLYQVQDARGVVVLPFAKPAPVRQVGAVWRKTTARGAAIDAVCKVIAARTG